MSVLVVGSFVTDCVATCERAPEAGETLIGKTFNTYLGGKGANQAFAAKRMGSEVIMAGAIGDDNFGDMFIKCMQDEKMDTKYVLRKASSTGTSLVTVEESGQNRICMVPGANFCYTVEDLALLEKEIAEADIIITQCEMQYEILKNLAIVAKKYNKKLLLNPAPACDLDKTTLNGVYCITPNETELGIIIHKELNTLEDYIEGAKELLDSGVENVIVTLGTKGSLLVNKEGHKLIPAFKVKAIDTVGAGDSFTGSLGACIDQGYSLLDAMQIATAVAALEVQTRGAIPAMPYRDSVIKFLKEKGHNYE